MKQVVKQESKVQVAGHEVQLVKVWCGKEDDGHHVRWDLTYVDEGGVGDEVSNNGKGMRRSG